MKIDVLTIPAQLPTIANLTPGTKFEYSKQEYLRIYHHNSKLIYAVRKSDSWLTEWDCESRPDKIISDSPHYPPEKIFTLTLSQQELNFVIKGLGKLSCTKSGTLYLSLQTYGTES